MAESITSINYAAVPETATKIFTGTAGHTYTLKVTASNASLGTPAATNITLAVSETGASASDCFTTKRESYLLGANTPVPVGSAIECGGRILVGTQELWAIASSATNGGIDLHVAMVDQS
jgi:hypothetical protein